MAETTSGPGLSAAARPALVELLLQSINEAPEEDHARIFQSFLVDSVESMRDHTIQQLQLLERVALLAVNNVQDVRLYSLEARVKELEEGKPVTFGEALGELFFSIAIESVLILGVTYGAPAVAGATAYIVARAATIGRSRRITRRVKLAARARSEKVIAEELAQLAVEEGALLKRINGRYHPRGLLHRSQQRATADLESVRARIDLLNRNRQVRIEELSGVSTEEVEVGVILDAAAEFSQLEPDLAKNLASFKDVYDTFAKSRAQAILSRTVLDAADSSQDLASDSSDAVLDTFTTTRCVTQLVGALERTVIDVRDHYAQMRALVALIPEDELLESIEAVIVMAEIDEYMLDIAENTENMIANLDAFVAPMELAVWLLYMEANNLLERDDSPNRQVYNGTPDPEARFKGDDLIVEVVDYTTGITDSPRMTCEKITYAGLSRLDEHQAYYLFHRFAKNTLDGFTDRIPVSETLEPGDFIQQDAIAERFDDVLSLPPSYFWSGENQERTTLVKEMKVVVIEYFRFVRETAATWKTLGFTDGIPEGTPISVLLANIEKPLHEVLPQEESPAKSVEELAEEQQNEAWALVVRSRLEVFEEEYDRAAGAYLLYDTTYRDLYSDTIGPIQYDDLFVADLRFDLQVARTNIESYVAELRDDDDGPEWTDEITWLVENLERKVASSPVDKEFFSTFPR